MNLMSLREYAAHKDGTYVSMDLDDQSKQMLNHFVEMNLGLDERVNPDTYHITIIYSRTPVPTAEKYASNTTDSTARVVGYEVFPTKNDGKCLVARLDFPFAEMLNSKLGHEGATSDYDHYKAHITLAYDTEQTFDVTSMPLPQFELKFGPVKVAPLDPQYTPENAK